MQRRSNFTTYEYLCATIFEYKRKYFIIQETQQGLILNPKHGSEQGASDFSALAAILDVNNINPDDFGAAILNTIDKFDTEPPPCDQFDFPGQRKFLKKWVGARAIGEFVYNRRTVNITFKIVENKYIIRPFANYTINSWDGPQGLPEIILEGKVSAREIGAAVLRAFQIATYNPNRTDPR